MINVLRAEEAIEILEKVLSSIKVRLIRCGIYLSLICCLGRYKEGWRYYEARFYCPDFEDVKPPISGVLPLQSLAEAPRNLVEEALVVWSEQGIGDVIPVLCRYIHLLDASSIPFIFPTSALPR